jgi:hypothetical protein
MSSSVASRSAWRSVVKGDKKRIARAKVLSEGAADLVIDELVHFDHIAVPDSLVELALPA